MYTLFIDTHFTNVTLILYKDGKLVNKFVLESNQSHSLITMPAIKELLEKEKLDIKNVGEIIVVNGPGSFTGVRIGVTIAKTIAYTLNIPIKAITTLEVLSSNIETEQDKIVAFNDRNGYFIGFFDKDNQLIKDYTYITNVEYKEFKNNNFVYDNFLEIDYQKVYDFSKSKKHINPHLVNPIYVKKIEVQK